MLRHTLLVIFITIITPVYGLWGAATHVPPRSPITTSPMKLDGVAVDYKLKHVVTVNGLECVKFAHTVDVRAGAGGLSCNWIKYDALKLHTSNERKLLIEGEEDGCED